MVQPARRVVAGIGFATAAPADEIIGLIDTCLAEAGCSARDLVAIATHARKLGLATPLLVAAHFGVPLRLLDDADLPSEGLAEAIAAAAGALLVRRRQSRYATCALAECGPEFTVTGFGQPSSPRAAIASSMVATSSAGP